MASATGAIIEKADRRINVRIVGGAGDYCGVAARTYQGHSIVAPAWCRIDGRCGIAEIVCPRWKENYSPAIWRQIADCSVDRRAIIGNPIAFGAPILDIYNVAKS